MRNKDIKLYAIICISLLFALLYYITMIHKHVFLEKKPQQKIALIFCGRIKGYSHVIPKLKEIINKYNPEIFLSVNESFYTDEIEQFSKDLKVPKSNMNVEFTLLPEWTDKCKLMNPIINTYSMFYHQNKSFTLLEEYQKTNKMIFDCILYYRADMNSKDMLDMRIPLKNTVYIPNDRGYGGFNDRMAYGDYESMKIYCSLIHSFEDLCVGDEKKNPEMILKTYLLNTKINIVKVTYNTDLHYSRNNKLIHGITDK